MDQKQRKQEHNPCKYVLPGFLLWTQTVVTLLPRRDAVSLYGRPDFGFFRVSCRCIDLDTEQHFSSVFGETHRSWCSCNSIDKKQLPRFNFLPFIGLSFITGEVWWSVNVKRCKLQLSTMQMMISGIQTFLFSAIEPLACGDPTQTTSNYSEVFQQKWKEFPIGIC